MTTSTRKYVTAEHAKRLDFYHGPGIVGLVNDLHEAHRGNGKASAKERAEATLAVLRKHCEMHGMNPDSECFMDQRHGGWLVSWESGPFEWAIPASFAMIDANGRLIEPYYGFDLVHYEED